MSTLSPCHLLSTLVWDLREKLNTLVYRLETQALMVAASRTQHIGRSSDEVERATDEVTRLESKLMSAAAEAAAEKAAADAAAKEAADAAVAAKATATAAQKAASDTTQIKKG